MSSTSNAVRAAEVEHARWRFFTTYRLQLQDCSANEVLLDAELEKRNLPISFENLSSVWESLTPQQRKAYAPPLSTNVVKPRRQEAVEAAPSAKSDPPPPVVADGALPVDWTPQKIKRASREELRPLYQKYGMAAVNDRLSGRS
jgi:hypothetical protein